MNWYWNLLGIKKKIWKRIVIILYIIYLLFVGLYTYHQYVKKKNHYNYRISSIDYYHQERLNSIGSEFSEGEISFEEYNVKVNKADEKKEESLKTAIENLLLEGLLAIPLLFFVLLLIINILIIILRYIFIAIRKGFLWIRKRFKKE